MPAGPQARQKPLNYLYLSPRGSRKVVAALARGVERSETTRATSGDDPNGATIQDRADSPGATTIFLRSKAPSLDMCPGETAATDAQWGDRAFERRWFVGIDWASKEHVVSL